MNYVNKITSACALLMAVAVCHGAELQEQTIWIKNDTKGLIYVGIYEAVPLKGQKRKIYKATPIAQGKCDTFDIVKSQGKIAKATQYTTIAFSTNKQAVKDKLKGQSSGAQTHIIRQFSGNRPLHYKITSGKGLITNKPKLKIDRVEAYDATCKEQSPAEFTEEVWSAESGEEGGEEEHLEF